MAFDQQDGRQQDIQLTPQSEVVYGNLWFLPTIENPKPGASVIPFLFCTAALFAAPQPDKGTVTLKGKPFLAEIARTDAERARGLMYRQHLAKDRCMFFVYDSDGARGIWMKNCLISLDVLWVTADGRIVEIVENAPPCSPLKGDDCPSYGGTVESRYWVEFPAGTLKRLGVRKGEHISWDLQLSDGQRLRQGGPARPSK